MLCGLAKTAGPNSNVWDGRFIHVKWAFFKTLNLGMHFLDYRVDEAKRRVFRGTEKLKFSTLNFDLLMYFLHHPGRVISRQELMQQVWQGRVVTDATIYKQVKRLKEELLEAQLEDELIQTAHGQGFVFVAEVHSAAEQAELNDATRTPKTDLWRVRAGLLWVLLPMAVVLAFVLYQMHGLREGNRQLVSQVQRLAILYGQGETADQPNQRAINEALNAQLLVSDALNSRLVPAQDRGAGFERNSASLIQELGYDHVLNMQVVTHPLGVRAVVLLRRGDVFVPPQLIEAADALTLVRDVSQWTAQQIGQPPSNWRPLTQSGDAFEQYLQGMRFEAEGEEADAIAALQQAVLLDGQFNAALVHLAKLQRNTGQVELALETLQRIDELRASDRERFLLLNIRGGCQYRLGQLKAAVQTFGQALEIARRLNDDTFLVSSLVNQAYMLSDLQQPEQARQNLEEALLHVGPERRFTTMGAIYSALTSLYKDNLHNLAKAREYAEQSHASYLQAGDEDRANVALNKWADVLMQAADFNQADALYQQVWQYSIDHKETVNGLYSLKSLIRIDHLYGRFDRAGERLARFAADLEGIDNAELAADHRQLTIAHALLLGHMDRAETQLQLLAEQVRGLDNPLRGQAYQALLTQWHLHNLRSVELPALRARLDEALPAGLQHSLLQAQISARLGDADAALEQFKAAERQARAEQRLDALVEVINAQLTFMFEQDRPDESVAALLLQLQELKAPPYPMLWHKMRHLVSLERCDEAAEVLQRLQETANAWWRDSLVDALAPCQNSAQ